MHHTRFSGKDSPLLFDPEIEKTARQNRVLHRSTGQIQVSDQEVDRAKSEMSRHDIPANQGVPIPPPPPPLPFQPPPVQPPPQQQYGYLQPPQPLNNARTTASNHSTYPNRHDTPPLRVGNMGNEANFRDRVAGWDDGVYENDLYEEEEWIDENADMEEYGPHQNVPQNYNRVPRGFNVGYQGQRRGNGPPPNNYNQFAGRPIPFDDGVPRVNHRAPIQGVDSHFRPIIAPNSSAIVTPVSRNGRAFEVRPQFLGHLPTFMGRGTEEPYLHISEFESIFGTMGGTGFT